MPTVTGCKAQGLVLLPFPFLPTCEISQGVGRRKSPSLAGRSLRSSGSRTACGIAGPRGSPARRVRGPLVLLGPGRAARSRPRPSLPLSGPQRRLSRPARRLPPAPSGAAGGPARGAGLGDRQNLPPAAGLRGSRREGEGCPGLVFPGDSCPFPALPPPIPGRPGPEGSAGGYSKGPA